MRLVLVKYRYTFPGDEQPRRRGRRRREPTRVPRPAVLVAETVAFEPPGPMATMVGDPQWWRLEQPLGAHYCAVTWLVPDDYQS